MEFQTELLIDNIADCYVITYAGGGRFKLMVKPTVNRSHHNNYLYFEAITIEECFGLFQKWVKAHGCFPVVSFKVYPRLTKNSSPDSYGYRVQTLMENLNIEVRK